jgi:type I restriction enzyme S subunit
MMRYRSKIDKKFTLYLVRTTLAQYKSKFATSTINQLTNTMIGDMQVPVPPISEQQEIANYLDEKTAKIDKLINELNNQLAELAEYKQAVISEAVTGKVDVRDYKSSL